MIKKRKTSLMAKNNGKYLTNSHVTGGAAIKGSHFLQNDFLSAKAYESAEELHTNSLSPVKSAPTFVNDIKNS